MLYKTNIIDDLLYLLNCALNSQKADMVLLSKMDLNEIFSLADFHKVAACAAFALDNIELNEESIKPWKQVKSMAIRKNILLNNERNKIYDYMENSSIWHVSLKGIVMQDLYPKFGMREMSDNDILYDSNYQEQMYKFMISRGYRAEIYKKIHHDEYLKPPIYNIELHTSLFIRSENPIAFEYYSSIINKFRPVSGKNFQFCFSDEDFYIYNVAHAYQHYVSGGTGLRILTDCYVYLKSKTLNFKYIENECEKLGILEFERICRSLSQKLFSTDSKKVYEKNNFTNKEELVFNHIINSGAYGRVEFRVQNKISKLEENVGNSKFIKIKYYFKRIFIPLEIIRDAYPVFYKHRILIPLLWIYRIFKAITIGRYELKAELQAVNKVLSKDK